jgi:hypothetical protein
LTAPDRLGRVRDNITHIRRRTAELIVAEELDDGRDKKRLGLPATGRVVYWSYPAIGPLPAEIPDLRRLKSIAILICDVRETIVSGARRSSTSMPCDFIALCRRRAVLLELDQPVRAITRLACVAV